MCGGMKTAQFKETKMPGQRISANCYSVASMTPPVPSVHSLSLPAKSTSPPRSQVRALVRDLAGMLTQQMFFWGCDAQHSGGNLLVRLGGMRLAREQQCGEGSSRYRFAWQDGTVELHSFCAGWYPRATESGVIFIRARERFFDCAGATPLTPGHYEAGRFRFANAEEMLVLCRPLLSWLLDYERQVAAATPPGYRARCFATYRQHGHSKPWLPPAEARAWLAGFLESPDSTRRAKKLLRERHQNFRERSPRTSGSKAIIP